MSPSTAARVADEMTTLTYGDHVCLSRHTRAEQLEAAIAFIAVGLNRKEKCVYLADEDTPEQVLEAMSQAGLDVYSAIHTGALQVAPASKAYLRTGVFDPDDMLRQLEQMAGQARQQCFKGLRITAEMTWVLAARPGAQRLHDYELRADELIRRCQAIAMCQYRSERFDAETLNATFRPHRLVMAQDVLTLSHYYMPACQHQPRRPRVAAPAGRLTAATVLPSVQRWRNWIA